MRIPRIFTSQPLASQATIVLDEKASHHLHKVLRMQEGRELTVFNGQGGEYPAVITTIQKKQLALQLGEHLAVERESPLHLELAIGISRGDRMDWVLQKATEMGVSKITPLFTARTEVHLSGERLAKKQQHWQQIITSACEQCQRNRLPELSAAQDLSSWLASCTSELRFVLHHRDSQGLSKTLNADQVALLIGPEGGLTETEIEEAQAAGCAPLTLGPRVLRTETAPLVAISLVQFLWGDI
jgi:16S rRNA (uracil1498-N3)-methyltransferase